MFLLVKLWMVPQTLRINEGEYDVEDSVKFKSSNEGDEDKSGRIWKKQNKKKRKKNIDLTSDFRCKKFEMEIDGSVKFEKYQIFINVNHFRDVLREYKIKNKHYVKRYINQKENV